MKQAANAITALLRGDSSEKRIAQDPETLGLIRDAVQAGIPMDVIQDLAEEAGYQLTESAIRRLAGFDVSVETSVSAVAPTQEAADALNEVFAGEMETYRLLHERAFKLIERGSSKSMYLALNMLRAANAAANTVARIATDTAPVVSTTTNAGAPPVRLTGNQVVIDVSTVPSKPSHGAVSAARYRPLVCE